MWLSLTLASTVYNVRSGGQGTHCTCIIDPVAVPALPTRRPVPTASGPETRFLFLLGYPHTGTSAMQYLLSTSASVSGILGNASRLNPDKEGMAHLPGGRPRGRWAADFPQIWEKAVAAQTERLYLEKALPGKLFVENSPPEIYLPHQLNSTFSKHGKVRFILLVHGICGSTRRAGRHKTPRPWDFCAFGACEGVAERMNITMNNNNRRIASWAMALHTYLGIIADFGEDVFVIRYEDICLRWGRVLRDLAAWEPRLADINISQSAKHTQSHVRKKKKEKVSSQRLHVRQRLLPGGKAIVARAKAGAMYRDATGFSQHWLELRLDGDAARILLPSRPV